MSSDFITRDDVILKSVCNRKWKKASYDKTHATRIQQNKSLDYVLSEMLSRRKLGCDEVDNFLDPKLKNIFPDPYILKNMDRGVNIAFSAIKNKKKISVFGDYDVDGATSSALLKRFFNMLGIELSIYIPDRVIEGYGPNTAALKKLKDSGTDLVITVDCGTASHEAIAEGKAMGLDILVLDHHISDTDDLPNADAIINPNIKGDISGMNNLAAVGVTFVFVAALLGKAIKEGLVPQDSSRLLLQLLDLVALGTVCDVVPLVGLNRVFVKQGLKILSNTQNTGLRALLDCLKVNATVTPYHLGFVLGPRINAGGRVGKSSLGAELLTCDNYDHAFKIATMLNNFNNDRKMIEANVLEEALEQASNSTGSNCIVVSGDNWHQGVIGIVASRIQERYCKPVVVISFDKNDIGKASCRSIKGINIGSLVSTACAQKILLKGGGHEMAAGFSVERKNLEDLKWFLDSNISKDIIDSNSNKISFYESVLASNHINLEFINKVNMLGPFGNGNEMPKFILPNVAITDVKIFQSSHVSCLIRDADNLNAPLFKAIAFRAIESPIGELLLSKGQSINIIVTLNINEWNNMKKPEVTIIDVII